MMPTKEALTHAAHFLEEDGYKCRHCVPVAEFLSKLASGWVLVPGEATDEMCVAGVEGYESAKSAARDGVETDPTQSCWDAMIAAAPKP